MKKTTYIIIVLFLNIMGIQIGSASCLNNSNSPIIVLPSAKIQQGLDRLYIDFLKKYYHPKFIVKFPSDLQNEMSKFCGLTFLPNKYLESISTVIDYDDSPLSMTKAIERSLSVQVRTIILTQIDSEVPGRIGFKAKAINVLDYSIITEKKETFTTNEVDNVEEKIFQLAKDMVCSCHRIGFGVGYQNGLEISLENIPDNIRRGRPYPDDLSRPDILDPSIEDNYFIFQNTTDIALPHRFSLDLHFRLWDYLNIVIKTSAIKESEIIEGKNYFRKSYVVNVAEGGDALIYYLIKSKNRSFFDAKSFSVPIYFTYPVFEFRTKRKLIINLLAGTNLLLPEKIEFEAEKGWHRFNAREAKQIVDLGELKETEYFVGIDIESGLGKNYRISIELMLSYKEYQENFKEGISLYQPDKLSPSIRLSFTKLFDSTLIF